MRCIYMYTELISLFAGQQKLCAEIDCQTNSGVVNPQFMRTQIL